MLSRRLKYITLSVLVISITAIDLNVHAKPVEPPCEQHLLSSYARQRAGDSADLIQRVRSSAQEISNLLKTDLGRQVQKKVRERFSEPQTRQSLSLADGRNLLFRYQGLGKGTDLVLQGTSGRKSVLIKSDEFGRAHGASLRKMVLSPDQRYVAVTYAKQGSIDGHYLLVFDLKKRKILVKDRPVHSQDVLWITNTRLLEETPKKGLRQIDVVSREEITVARKGEIVSQKRRVAVVKKGSQYFLFDDGNEYELNIEGPYYVVGEEENYIYLRSDSRRGSGDDVIYGIPRAELREGNLKYHEVVKLNAYGLDRADYLSGYFVVERNNLEGYGVEIYSRKGELLAKIPTPVGSTVSSWSWHELGRTIQINYSNPVWPVKGFLYKIEGQQNMEMVEREMLTSATGQKFEVSVIDVKSDDGTRFPMSLFYKEGLLEERHSQHPVLMRVYGGFGLEGYFNFRYDGLENEFLKNGGILAGPAVRGGNEFGRAWHEAAKGVNKPNTFHDVIAAIEALFQERITSQQKMILMGGSNGGVSAATVGLMRPDLVGLTIPINGVLNFTNREYYDEPFNGWVKEYGSIQDEAIGDIGADHSPCVLARFAEAGNFLVVTGLNDSRVDPRHSDEFVERLRANPKAKGECLWLALKNAGHWMNGTSYQHWHAWYTQAVMLTAIYRQVGWTLD